MTLFFVAAVVAAACDLCFVCKRGHRCERFCGAGRSLIEQLLLLLLGVACCRVVAVAAVAGVVPVRVAVHLLLVVVGC